MEEGLVAGFAVVGCGEEAVAEEDAAGAGVEAQGVQLVGHGGPAGGEADHRGGAW